VEETQQLNWKQTFPLTGYHQVTIGETDVSGLDFGNVYERGSTGGYTPATGATRTARPRSTARVDGVPERVQPGRCLRRSLRPRELPGLPHVLLSGTATNMSYMLSVQMAATLLNIQYKGTDYTGLGVIGWDGDWISVADLVSEANAFLAAHPVTNASDPLRAQPSSTRTSSTV